MSHYTKIEVRGRAPVSQLDGHVTGEINKLSPLAAVAALREHMENKGFFFDEETAELFDKLHASLASVQAQPVAWMVYAEDSGTWVPQHPAHSQRSFAEHLASRYGQTPTEVRALFDHAVPAPSAPAAPVPAQGEREAYEAWAETEARRDPHVNLGNYRYGLAAWQARAALAAVPPVAVPDDRAEVLRIADLPDVHEALSNFSHDPTEDSGIEVVREVLKAAAPHPADAGQGDGK